MVETCCIEETREDLRQFVRHDASLSFSIPLSGAESIGSTDEPPMLVSHTSDVSAGGMALLVPSLPFLYRYLLGVDCTLRFALHLPDGPPVNIEATPICDRPISEKDMNLGFMVTGRIEIEAIPRQYERYEKEREVVSCLIGVRIKKMSDSDHARYMEYLEILELERSIKILTDEGDLLSIDEIDVLSIDEIVESDDSLTRFASTDSRPRYFSAGPYDYS